MSAKEVASRHGVDTTTVYRWIASGELPARRLAGRRYVIRREDCEALLAPVEVSRPMAGWRREQQDVEAAVRELRARGIDVG